MLNFTRQINIKVGQCNFSVTCLSHSVTFIMLRRKKDNNSPISIYFIYSSFLIQKIVIVFEPVIFAIHRFTYSKIYHKSQSHSPH